MTLKVAIYSRVSTKEQSCERQERELLDYSERAGYYVVTSLQEVGSGKKDNRPKRAKLIQLAKQRKIQAILVSELTRWGRSTTDLLSTIQDLASYEVRLIALNGTSFDVGSAQGKLILTVLSAISEFERDLLVERVKSGLEAAKARGQKLGRVRGHCPRQEQIRETVLMFHREKKSIREIAQLLSADRRTVTAIIRESTSIEPC